MATSMSRQHFQSIADAVADYERYHGDEPFDADIMAQQLATHVRQYNPRFNRDRFIAACTINSPKAK